MKVVLISPYSASLVGGVVNWTKYIVDFYHVNVNRGDIEMILLNNDNAVGMYGRSGFLRSITTGLYNYIPICRRFRELVSKEHFDVVHISSSGRWGFLRDLFITKIAQYHNVRVIVHMHFGRIPQIIETHGGERLLLLHLINRIDRVVVMDMSSFRALSRNGFDNISYLPNPLSSEVTNLISNNIQLRRITNRIVFAGHIIESKGVFELVKACKEINDVQVDLFGYITDESIKYKLMELSGGASWLHILGNKTQEEVIQAMLSCSIFVLPSYSEGFPNVILESMACGCPIISTPVGAIPEMLDIEGAFPCGVCVPVKDSIALKEAIVSLLSNQNLAYQLGMRARKRVLEHYSMPEIWSQLVRIWLSVLD